MTLHRALRRSMAVLLTVALTLTMVPWNMPDKQVYGDSSPQLLPVGLENGDFEGELNDKGLPMDWRYWISGVSADVTVSDSVYATGNQSIHFDVDQQNVGVESKAFAVQEGEILNVTASVYAEQFSTTGSDGGIDMWVRYFNSDVITNANRIQYQDVKFKIPAAEVVQGQWVQLGGDTPPVPEGAQYAIVFLYSHRDNTFKGYYDHVQAYRYQVSAEETTPPNAGFEQPVNDGVIPGWTTSPNPLKANTMVEVSQVQAASGSHSLRITDDNSESAVLVYSDYMDVEAGKSYGASTNLYIAEGSGRIYIKYYDASNDEVGSMSQGAEAPVQSWNRVTVEGKAPAGAVKARILLYSGYSTIDVDAYYDDVTFEEVTVLTMTTEFGEPVSLGDATVVAKTNGGAIGNGEIYFGASGSPAQFYALDAITGDVKFTAEIPSTDVIWAVTVGSDGNPYVAGTQSGIMYRYNRATQELESLGENPSNKWIWDLDASADGKIYGSTYPDSKAFEYDISTGQYSDYGTLYPGQEYVRGSGVTDKYFYAGITTEGHLIRIDRQTGDRIEINTPITGIRAGISSIEVYDQKLYLTHGTSLLIMNEDENNYDAGGETITYTTVKRLLYEDPEASDGKISPPSPHNSDLMYYRNQHTSELWTYNRVTNEAAAVTPQVILPDKRLKAMNWVELTEGPNAGRKVLSMLSDEVDLAIFDPVSHTLETKVPDVAKSGIEINSFELGPDNKFYMGGYQGAMSIYDTNKGYFERQEKEPHQISSTGFLNNKVYFGLYGGAKIWRYDLSQPYNLGVNPGFYHDIPAMQSRTMTFTSGDDRLFIGSVADYGQLGGALTVYHEPTDEWNTYQNVIQNQSIIGLAYHNGKLYGGSSIWGGLGIDPSETSAKMFEWDAATASKTAEFIPNVPGFEPKMIGELSIGPDGNLYGIMWGTSLASENSSALFVMDPENKDILRYRILTTGQKASNWRPFFLYWAPDGLLYTTIGRQLMVFDPQTLAYNKLITPDVHVMALGPDGSVYYKKGSELMRLPVRMTGASLSAESASVPVGQSTELPVTLQLMNGLNGNSDGTDIAYQISDASIASIEDGVLTGLKEGTVTISASVLQDTAAATTNTIEITVTAAEEPAPPGSPNAPVTQNPASPAPVSPQTPQPPVREGEQSFGSAELQKKDADQGGVSISLKQGMDAAVLPYQADEWLDGSHLQVQSEHGTLHVPFSTFQELKKLYPSVTDAQMIVSLQEPDEEAPRTDSDVLKAGSEVLEVHMYLRSSAGEELHMNTFSEPLKLEMPYLSTQVDEELIGMYRYNDSSSTWVFVGGEIMEGRSEAAAELDRPGTYAILEYNKTFVDVPMTHWAHRTLQILSAKHIVEGMTEERFFPRAVTTRAEFTALLVRALGLAASAGDTDFTDVPDNAWYADDIAAAVQAGLVQGITDSSFAPSEPVTREQIAVLLVRAYEWLSHEEMAGGNLLSNYMDSTQVSPWAGEDVNKAILLGLMSGRGESVFDPASAANRAETAQSVLNLLKRMK
ncbi:S-layer homology domain-containing protein [Paenibacillus sp. F411]|uniref:S-layer homology domain-containing protein n=1 Tax=Paenibacillus sp. F411 TaxID=2820239 RepID=UPI001AAF5A96|nr:S-layer homology domain-containing protein [Paenibacillus sp. F411]MBO2943648.1 S-layer homology domain-containing protein [Paenibacillus sp. F411]